MKITKYAGILLAIAYFAAFSSPVSAFEAEGENTGAVSAVNGSAFSATAEGGNTGAVTGSGFSTPAEGTNTGAVIGGGFSAPAEGTNTGVVTTGSTGNPGTPGNPGSTNNNTSGGSHRSSNSNPIALNGISAVSATSSCPLITDFLKLGGANSGMQVTKLQMFLKNSENLNVDVNGIFDQKTFDAVSAFQNKYLSSIMGPWGATRSSGFVYITTLKKINEISCAQPMNLSAEELAIIESYKQRGSNSANAVSNSVDSSNTNATGTLEVGSIDSENNNAAAVGEASIFGRFWLFIKGLFR